MTDARADRRLRVCLLSENLSWPLDEGFKKLVYSLADPLAQLADLLVLTTRATGVAGTVPPHVRAARANRLLLGLDLARTIRRFRPDVVIYVPQAAATLNSFIRCGVLRAYAPRARLLLVALQPRSYGRAARYLIPRLRPDLVLVQSLDTQDSLRAFGCQTAMLPSGIDTSAFQPVPAPAKAALRAKYGLAPDTFVVLHVGHQSRTRNVLLLNRIRAEMGCETVLVASTSTQVDRGIAVALRQGGTRVIDRYVEHVAELYQMADCYLFPVHESTSSVNMPLSVLEAMACGLPVVTTPFGSLPLWFNAGPGFVFAGTDDELVAAVARLYRTRERILPDQMRAQVAPFSWPAVAGTLLAFARSATPQSVQHPAAQQSISGTSETVGTTHAAGASGTPGTAGASGTWRDRE